MSRKKRGKRNAQPLPPQKKIAKSSAKPPSLRQPLDQERERRRNLVLDYRQSRIVSLLRSPLTGLLREKQRKEVRKIASPILGPLVKAAVRPAKTSIVRPGPAVVKRKRAETIARERRRDDAVVVVEDVTEREKNVKHCKERPTDNRGPGGSRYVTWCGRKY